MRLALYQPDIPQNTGAMLRLAACFGLAVDVIEPCGFVFDDKRLRRVGMDYLGHVEVKRHTSWAAYLAWRKAAGDASGNPGRLILLSTGATLSYAEVQYGPADSLLVGQESSGVPDTVRDVADLAVRIPMRPGVRSLNVAMAAAIVAGEAMRQVGILSA